MQPGRRFYGTSRLFSTGLLLLTGILAHSIVSGPAAAGTMEEGFVALLNRTPDRGSLRGLIALADQTDVAALESEMTTLGLRTRSARPVNGVHACGRRDAPQAARGARN